MQNISEQLYYGVYQSGVIKGGRFTCLYYSWGEHCWLLFGTWQKFPEGSPEWLLFGTWQKSLECSHLHFVASIILPLKGSAPVLSPQCYTLALSTDTDTDTDTNGLNVFIISQFVTAWYFLSCNSNIWMFYWLLRFEYWDCIVSSNIASYFIYVIGWYFHHSFCIRCVRMYWNVLMY